jgi:Mg2+-importing ATPase
MGAVAAMVVGATLLLPYSPLAPVLGLAPLPGGLMLTVAGIVVLYFVSAEGVKRLFYRNERRRLGARQ